MAENYRDAPPVIDIVSDTDCEEEWKEKQEQEQVMEEEENYGIIVLTLVSNNLFSATINYYQPAKGYFMSN